MPRLARAVAQSNKFVLLGKPAVAHAIRSNQAVFDTTRGR